MWRRYITNGDTGRIQAGTIESGNSRVFLGGYLQRNADDNDKYAYFFNLDTNTGSVMWD